MARRDVCGRLPNSRCLLRKRRGGGTVQVLRHGKHVSRSRGSDSDMSLTRMSLTDQRDGCAQLGLVGHRIAEEDDRCADDANPLDDVTHAMRHWRHPRQCVERKLHAAESDVSPLVCLSAIQLQADPLVAWTFDRRAACAWACRSALQGAIVIQCANPPGCTGGTAGRR